MPQQQPILNVVVDPRLLDAVVTFTGQVADVAATLSNLGLADEAGRLTDALDHLDAAPGDDRDAP